MAIADFLKLDILWKLNLFGVASTDTPDRKAGPNETIPALGPVLPSQIWADASLIASPPPSTSNTVVSVLSGAARIAATADPTAEPNRTWLTGQQDFIPPTFGSGYAARVYIGDPNTGPAARIFPGAPGEEWVFNYAAGVLFFPQSIPASKPASIGTGTVSVGANGIYIEAYRYIGAKGAGSGGGSGSLGTMSLQDADNVAVTGGTLDNVTLTNVTVDGGTF